MKTTISLLFVLILAVCTYSQTVTLRGRTMTENGKPIRRSLVTMTDATSGERRTVITNPFGYFNFGNLVRGRSYLFETRHKKYEFYNVIIVASNPTNTLSLTGMPIFNAQKQETKKAMLQSGELNLKYHSALK